MFEERYDWSDDGLVRSVAVDNYVHKSFIKTQNNGEEAALAWWKAYLRGVRSDSLSSGHGQKIKIVDLFSGCGGLGLGVIEGLAAAGFKPTVEVAVDVDGEGLQVYRHNLKPTAVIHGSVATLVDFQIFGQGENSELAYEPEIIDPTLVPLKGKIDVICAGPPCQGHSNLNNHSRREDPRNLLYLSVPAIAVGLGVSNVIIENVPEVTNDKFGVVETAIALFKSAGYTVTSHVIHASTLGCAQTRRRYFLVASKNPGLQQLADVMKAIAKPNVDLEWAIGDLVDVEPISVMNTVPVFSTENQRRIDFLFDTELYELPNEIRPDCHKDGHTYGSVYGRLKWDKPSQTITTGFLTPGRGRYIHPVKRRVITPHEAARIQSFPDSFVFCLPGQPEPSRTKLTKWIGDAVPSVMGYAAALCAATAMVNKS